MARALERREAGEASVIPIILRPVSWKETPFGKLQALPEGGKAVTNWTNRDEAFLQIAEGIRKVVTPPSFEPPNFLDAIALLHCPRITENAGEPWKIPKFTLSAELYDTLWHTSLMEVCHSHITGETFIALCSHTQNAFLSSGYWF